MLKKLFLHDLRSTSRLSVVLALCGFGLAGLCMLAELIMSSMGTDLIFANISVSMLYLLLYAGAFGLSVSPFFVFLFYAYKSWFSDEGYLTFVLPASETAHILSKFFAGAIWAVLSLLSVYLTSFIANELPYLLTRTDTDLPPVAFETDVVADILCALLPFITVVSLMMICLFAIIAGSCLMPKAKIIGIILFAAAACLTAGVAITTVSVIAVQSGSTSDYPYLIAQLVFFPLTALAGYFLAHRTLLRAINLD